MSTRTRILIVEHNPNDVDMIRYELKKGGIDYVSEIVQTEHDYAKALKSFSPDIILSDYSLPSFDGPMAFHIKEEMAPDTPFIFVSGTIGEENSIEYIKNGVTDYALKDKLFTLPTKVKRALKDSEEARQKYRTEQDRIQNEKRLARAQQLAHMGSWELEGLTNTLIFSDEGCRIYGFAPDQHRLSFDAWTALVHPEDIDRVLLTLRKSEASFRDSSFHHRIIRPDGSIRYVYSESKYELNANGEPIGMYGIMQDETERKLAEEQREFDANNLASLINNTKDLMWSVDTSFRLITSNQAFAELVRSTSGTIVSPGINLMDTGLSKESQRRYQTYYERAFAGEIFTETEYADTPVERWSEISFYPIRQGDKIIGTACYSHDVTFSKKAENEIRKLNETSQAANHKLSTILNTLPANIAVLDKSGTIIAINDAWRIFGENQDCHTTGYRIGDDYLEICDTATGGGDRSASEMSWGIKNVLGGSIREYAHEYPCHSASEKKWFRVEVRPLTEIKYPGVVVMHFDITEQKMAEYSITEMNSVLEDKVNIRTKELTEANVALEAFSYSVSHDLRSPIGAIIGFSKIINQDFAKNFDPELRELFGYIEKSSLRMSAIINDLLVLAKYGSEKLNIQTIDLMELFKSVWDNILFTSPHHAVLDLPEMPAVRADRSMLQQVIVNLLSNAIKYSSKRENPRITIGYVNESDRVILSIKDNGAGFNMKFYDKLFGAFQRLHGVSEFEGTGVGLMLVKRIIDRHGGEVWAEGKVNEGATFYFSLPVLKG